MPAKKSAFSYLNIKGRKKQEKIIRSVLKISKSTLPDHYMLCFNKRFEKPVKSAFINPSFQPFMILTGCCPFWLELFHISWISHIFIIIIYNTFQEKLQALKNLFFNTCNTIYDFAITLLIIAASNYKISLSPNKFIYHTYITLDNFHNFTAHIQIHVIRYRHSVIS